MATNRFFDNQGLGVIDGELAKAIQLNSVTDETNKAFELVETELDSLSNSAPLSYAWANWDQGQEIDPINNPGEYSSKANAQESYGWAAAPGGTQTEADGVTLIPNSAKDYYDMTVVLHDQVESWYTDISAWYPEMQGWHSDVSSWYTQIQAWHQDISNWYNQISSWYTDISQWYTDIAAWYPEIIDARDRAEDAADEAEAWAKLAEQYAEDAKSVACQDLASVQKTISGLTGVVETFIYDTSKDSDGGLWRKRCQNLSWYNEPLNTATRGKTREFPALALIVNSFAVVYIYDLTDPTVPMWMVINGGSGMYDYTNPVAFSMLNGFLSIADGTYDLWTIDFLKDEGIRFLNNKTTKYPGNIAERNLGRTHVDLDARAIADRAVNDVSMTVIDTAPIDQTTGLPVPTIAVATDGGVSVIDGPAGVGTVVDTTISNPTYNKSLHVDFDDRNMLVMDIGNTATGVDSRWIYTFESYAADNEVTINTRTGTTEDAIEWYDLRAPKSFDQDLILKGGTTQFAAVVAGENRYAGTGEALSVIKADPATPANAMVAEIAPDYNTGFMRGDIKLATLSDTVEGTLGTDISTELITNGVIDDEYAWVLGSPMVIADGELNTNGSNGALTYQTVAAVIGGNTYRYQISGRNHTVGYSRIRFGSSGVWGETISGDGILSDTILAGGANVTLQAQNVSTNYFDDFYVWDAGPELIQSGTVDETEPWVLEADWAIASGIATKTPGSTGRIYQSPVVTDAVYRVQYDILNYTAGSIAARATGTGYDWKSSEGIHTTILQGNADTFLLFEPNSTFDGSIDNTYCWLAGDEEITGGVVDDAEGWTIGSDWSIGSGVISKAGGAYFAAENSFSVSASTAYRGQLSILTNAGGACNLDLNGTVVAGGTSPAIYTGTATSIAAGPARLSAGSFNGTVDDTYLWLAAPDIVVNGDFANWTGDDPDNWTVASEDANNYITAQGTPGARIVSDNTAAVNMGQVFPTVIGDTYEVTITKVNHVNGFIRAQVTPDVPTFNMLGSDADGSYSFTFKATTTGSQFYIFRDNTGATDYVVDTVVCRKITDLVENGEFSSDRAWALGTGWSITGGELVAASASAATQTLDTPIGAGKTYVVQFEVTQYTSGSVRLASPGGIEWTEWASAVGAYKGVWTATSGGSLVVQQTGSFTGALGQVKLYEAELVNGTWQPVGNLIVNPGFEGVVLEKSEWWPAAGAEITAFESNMRVTNASVAYGYAYQILATEIGKTYETSLYYTHQGTAALFRVGTTQGGSENLTIGLGATGTVVATWKATATTTYLRIGNNANTVGSYTDWNDITTREITDLVENGEFSSDRAWTKDAGWTIGSGVASANGSNISLISDTNVAEVGKTYIMQYEVTARTSGYFLPQIGGTQGIARTTVGVFKDVVTAVNTSAFRVIAGSNTVGSIDNVKLYEAEQVDGNWVPVGNLVVNPSFEGTADLSAWVPYAPNGSLVYIESGNIVLENGAAANAYMNQTITTEVGETYELSADYVDLGSGGTVDMRVGTGINGNQIGNISIAADDSGILTFKATTTTTYINFRVPNSTIGSKRGLNNITTRKITDVVENGEFSSDRAWTKGDGWSIASGVASCDGTQVATSYLTQSGIFDIDATYIAQYEITAYTAGTLYSYIGANLGQAATATGVYKDVIVAGSANGGLRASPDFVGTVDNVKYYEAELVNGTWQPVGNLVVNPSFEGWLDDTKWLANGTDPIALEGDLSVAGSVGGGLQTVYQTVTTTPGQKYTVSTDLIEPGNQNRYIRICNGTNANDYIYRIDNDKFIVGTNTGTFEAEQATTYIHIGVFEDNAITVNNVGVKGSQNLVKNGEFSYDGEWTKGTGWTIGSGVASCDGTQTTSSNLQQEGALPLTTDKYLCRLTVSGFVAGGVRFVLGGNGVSNFAVADGEFVAVVESSGQNDRVIAQANLDFIGSIDDVSVEPLPILDRSVNANHLQVVGEVNRTKVAPGADLVRYKGENTTGNYVEQPHNPDYNFGADDFYSLIWIPEPIYGTQAFWNWGFDTREIGFLDVGGQQRFYLNTLNAVYYTGSLGTQPILICAYREAGVAKLNYNGVEVASAAFAAAINYDASYTLWLGADHGDTTRPWLAPLSLFRMGAGAPSLEQLTYIYEMEKHLFTEEAKCTIYGTDPAVVSLEYDEATNQLQCVTGPTTSVFQGLRRVSESDNPVTPAVSGAMVRDRQAVASATQVDVTIPAFNLREELEDKDRQIASLDMPVVQHVSVGIGQTAVKLPMGYYPETVYDAGVRVLPTEIKYDGFYYYVHLSASTGDVIIDCRVIPKN